MPVTLNDLVNSFEDIFKYIESRSDAESVKLSIAHHFCENKFPINSMDEINTIINSSFIFEYGEKFYTQMKKLYQNLFFHDSTLSDDIRTEFIRYVNEKVKELNQKSETNQNQAINEFQKRKADQITPSDASQEKNHSEVNDNSNQKSTLHSDRKKIEKKIDKLVCKVKKNTEEAKKEKNINLSFFNRVGGTNVLANTNALINRCNFLYLLNTIQKRHIQKVKEDNLIEATEHSSNTNQYTRS